MESTTSLSEASSYSFASPHPHEVKSVDDTLRPDRKSSQSFYANPSDVVERILNACERRQAMNATPAQVFDKSQQNIEQMDTGSGCDGGSLTRIEIHQLGLISSAPITSNKEAHAQVNSGWKSVELSDLSTIVSLLQGHVVSAGNINLISSFTHLLEISNSPSKDLKQLLDRGNANDAIKKCGLHRVSALRRGLEAATVLLSIMTFPDIDRRIISEDSIVACVALLRQHLCRNILPALAGDLSQKGNVARARKRQKSVDSKPPQSVSNVGSRSQANSQETESATNRINKFIASTVGNLTVIMELMEVLIRTVSIDDQALLSITSAALSSLAIEPATTPQSNAPSCHLIQISAVALVCAVFQRYTRHRRIIIEDLFPIMLKLPTSKRSMRTLPLIQKRIDNSATNNSSTSKSSSKGTKDDNYIQVITHLILTLFQSCVIMPTQKDVTDADAPASRPKLESGLAECHVVCDFFVSQLVQRCVRKGQDGGASEFRPILCNLVDDLLCVKLIPQYPVSDMLLTLISQRISTDLIRISSSNPEREKITLEPTYLNTAMDVLGKICASTAGMLSRHRESPLELPDANNESIDGNNMIASDSGTNRCFCGRVNFVDTFMLDCDRCHAWFHGSCVGVTKDNLPNVWYCDECTMQAMINEQTKKFSEKRKSRTAAKSSDPIIKTSTCVTNEENVDLSIDKTHVFRQLLLNSLSELASSNSEFIYAKQFLISKWVEEFESQRNTESTNINAELLIEHYLDQWSDLTTATTPAATCSSEGNAKVMMALVATTSDLAKGFPHILGVFVKLLGDDLVSLRKLAVKSISQIVNADSSLMLHPRVRKAVNQRFIDDAISVREAAVNLVGTYVLLDPLVADAFHPSLVARLNDVGVSVRKRAVKIFHDILLTHSDYQGRTEACTKMLQRAADSKEDDKVRDVIFETFQDLWFNPKTACQSGNIRQSIGQKNISKNYHDSAMQMVEVVETSGNDPGFLSSFVRKMLFDFEDTDKEKKIQDKKVRRDEAKVHCGHLVNAIVEELLHIDERKNHRPPEYSGNNLIALISTLYALSQNLPTLLVKHVDTLLPYLKADNGLSREEESNIVTYISKIIGRVVPHLKKTEIKCLSSSDISEDLLRITYTFNSTSISAAVEALAGIAGQCEGDNKPEKTLMKLLTTFYGYLYKVLTSKNDFSSLQPNKMKQNTHRALSVLGSVCRFYPNLKEYYKDDQNLDPNLPFQQPSALSPRSLLTASYSILMFILAKFQDIESKCAALRAMTGILIAHPKALLSLQQTGFIEEVMSVRAPPLLQIEAMQCWKEVLLAEEERIESGVARNQMLAKESTSKRISGDQDGDATLIGGILNHYANCLFEMALAKDPTTRFVAVDLMGNLLRMGLINPMESIPYLFALQGDVENVEIRTNALKLLSIEGEKRPDMLRQRIRVGVRHAFSFQRMLKPDSNITAIIEKDVVDEAIGQTFKEVECIFGPIFKESFKSSKSQRQGLYLSLLGLFYGADNNLEDGETDGNGSVAGINIITPFDSAKKPKNQNKKGNSSICEQLPLLSYASEVLAHLPYEQLSDPLFIIYQISCITAVQGAQLLDRFSSLLGTDEVDVDNSEADFLEVAAANYKNPGESKEASILHHPRFSFESFSDMCAEASALILLLRLKKFLASAYSLSDAKCLEYQPSQKDRVADKVISSSHLRRNISRFNSGFCYSIMGTDSAIDQKIHIYAEFRRSMRGSEVVLAQE